MRSDRTLKAYYREINTRFFDNELPDNVCVRWADEDELAAEKCEEGDFCGWADKCEDGRSVYKIVIDTSLRGQQTLHLCTLVHEMIHVATELRDDHGPAFDRWHKLLTTRGLFKKGALRRGLTLF
jgi:hypothetical protein